MSRRKLILVVSDRMDRNKKKGRNEHRLIRMSAAARSYMGFEGEYAEVWPPGLDANSRSARAAYLRIFQAFSSDIKLCKEEGMSADELKRVGFVTAHTFQKIVNDQDVSAFDKANVWIADDIHETVIGADPEFLLYREDGSIIHACDVMGKTGKVGSDGAMAEVRPDPAITSEDLVKNIRSIFSDGKLVKPIKDFKWKSGCFYKNEMRNFPIGGHIHIGNPIRIANLPMEQRKRFFAVMNKILDELLSLIMVKLDGKEAGSTRRTKCIAGPFGYFGEWRTCSGRLEHRTLSGMWLTHPTLARCVLGSAKAIIDATLKEVAKSNYDPEFILPKEIKAWQDIYKKSFSDWKKIPLAETMKCLKDSKTMYDTLQASDPSSVNKQALDAWKKKMRALTSYNDYEKDVEGLYEILNQPVKKLLSFDRTLQSNWLENKGFVVDV